MDARLVLAAVLSILLMFVLFPVLSWVWAVLFPKSVAVSEYASRFATPVHVALPIGSALFFYALFLVAEREGWFNPRSALSLLVLVLAIFLAYYVGIGGFYFFRYTDARVMGTAFTYFLYVPYWTVLPGLLAAWIAYTAPLPKFFKKEETQSSR